MSKKIIYSIGGIIILILIAAIIPATKPAIVQEQKNNIITEPLKITATTSPETKTAQPEKPTPVTATKTNPQYEFYPVSEIVDGDTVKVNINGTIETLRLIGMDTPETVDPRKPVQCF